MLQPLLILLYKLIYQGILSLISLTSFLILLSLVSFLILLGLVSFLRVLGLVSFLRPLGLVSFLRLLGPVSPSLEDCFNSQKIPCLLFDSPLTLLHAQLFYH